MWYLLAAITAFGFNFAHFFVGAKISLAEKNLQVDPAGDWAFVAAGLGWVDDAIFLVLLVDKGILTACLACALPSMLGARYGERWSVRQDFVLARIARKKKALAVASKPS